MPDHIVAGAKSEVLECIIEIILPVYIFTYTERYKGKSQAHPTVLLFDNLAQRQRTLYPSPVAYSVPFVGTVLGNMGLRHSTIARRCKRIDLWGNLIIFAFSTCWRNHPEPGTF